MGVEEGLPSRSVFRLPGPSRSAPAWIHIGWRKKITSIKILRLTFKSDHHVMKDNNSDWNDSGSLFTKPEWTFGNPSQPISHTKNLKVLVSVDFEVNPPDADETDADVTGTAAFGSLVFKPTSATKFKGGVITVEAESSAALPDTVDKLTGDIKWSVATKKDGTFDAGASWGHTIYVTIDTPIAVTGTEAGFTQKRMDKSVELVKATGKANAPWADAPLAIILELMKLIPGYTLVPNDSVNTARPGISHPTYFNSIGGAWNLADFISKSAECQAIVRFFRAVIKQVGCPGTAQIMLIYADPNVDNGNTVLEDDFEAPPAGGGALHHVAHRTINGHESVAALLDENPGSAPGKIFDGNRRGRVPGIGLNAFEACMKFTSGATVKYFPGGTGGGVLDTKEQVIFVFQALAWMSDAPGGHLGEMLVKVEKIVKKYH